MKRLEGQRVAGSSAARRSLTRGGVFSAMRSSVSIRLIIAVVYPRWSERAGQTAWEGNQRSGLLIWLIKRFILPFSHAAIWIR